MTSTLLLETNPCVTFCLCVCQFEGLFVCEKNGYDFLACIDNGHTNVS